jgi:hypothetical protein
MTINIQTEKAKIYIHYLNVVNYSLPKSLTGNEIKVLATMMYIRNIYSHVKDTNKLIFTTSTKKRIQQSLKLSVPVFNNTLSSLRKKKIFITKDRLLLKEPVINNEISVNYKIKIK